MLIIITIDYTQLQWLYRFIMAAPVIHLLLGICRVSQY